jgi:hypothetical protein
MEVAIVVLLLLGTKIIIFFRFFIFRGGFFCIHFTRKPKMTSWPLAGGVKKDVCAHQKTVFCILYPIVGRQGWGFFQWNGFLTQGDKFSTQGNNNSEQSKQKKMRSKQYPYEVYVLRKSVNHLRESRQAFPGERVNLFSTGRQVLKRSLKDQPYSGKDILLSRRGAKRIQNTEYSFQVSTTLQP